jgi:thiamine transport system ATP-binding protein
MIRVENGFYSSGEFTLNCDFEIAAGSFCAVLGPSGAGKSTLLSVLAGFEQLTRGRVILDGVDATDLSPDQRPISMVFQDNNVFPHLTVAQNVALGISPSLRLSAEQNKTVSEALEHVKLSSLVHKRPGEISGGERQRVALARVLVRAKKILLLDEAFAALDPGLRQNLMQQVAGIAQECKLTTLMVTHQPDEVRAVADHVMFIADSEVRPPVATRKFFASKEPAIATYLGTPNLK